MSQLRSPLAVVGVSAMFPGSQDGAGFWRDLLAGRDLIRDVPESHWLIDDYYDPDPRAADKTYAKRGAFLDPVDFDPLEHGVPPSIVPATDTSQLLALIVAKQVLEDATRGDFDRVDRDRVSVILGVTSAQELLVQAASRLQRPVWVKALREHGLPEPEVQAVCDRIADSYTPWQESTFPGLLGNVIAGRIANRLNLGGTNCVTDAACASSFSALAMGAQELWLQQSDLVIVGGVETFNDIFMYMCFSKTPALSPTGECRPFAEGSDGTLLGEGLGMLAIRRLDDAERDGDRIYAVIRGIGSSSDGRAKSVYAPLPQGQALALRRAYDAAGYGPDTVELIEAHGTGTRAGDAAEFEGLRSVFDGCGREDRQWCALGTVKSQIGHTKAAAGVAGLFKAIMAVHHRVLPPTIKVDRPNPALKLEASPFYLNTRSRPWVRGPDHPRRASVSSFGFGGSNFHVAVEEYRGPQPAPRFWTSPSELLLLSADGPESLLARCREIRRRAAVARSLALLAQESWLVFDASQPARLALVAADEEELRRKLERAEQHLAERPERPLSTPDGLELARGARDGKLAFLFPGQGSQYLNMGADLAMALPQAQEVWDAASGLALPTPLHEVVFPRPGFSEDERDRQLRRLTQTEWAQPAIGVASLALLGVLRAAGVTADAVAGHSFGELTALCAAGALSARETVRLARRRGELMALVASEPGAMLAVQHPLAELERLLAEHGGDVSVANHNSPRQVVLSGAAAAIDAVAARLAERGIAARRLPVATAFHSPLVASASPLFLEALGEAKLQAPRIPVFANRDAARYPAEPQRIRERLAEQIARPVRFAEQIEELYAAGVRTFVEVGPGAVLTQLAGDCLEGRPHRALALDRKGRHGLTALWIGLAKLAAAGVPVDPAALRAGFRPAPEPAAQERPAHALSISGANYAKPYPPAGGAAALPKPNPARPAAVPPATPAAEQPLERAAPPPADGDGDWLHGLAEMQRQTAQAHEAYLQAMADSHAAFLEATTTSREALAGLLGRGAPSVARAQAGPAPAEGQADLEARAGAAAPAPVAWAAAATEPTAPVPEPTPRPLAPAATDPAVHADAPGLHALLLEVVADKTGYPADMLRPEMQLEADLGIDSIKRVEILAALQERAPTIPEVQPADVAELRSLGQIVAFLDREAPAQAPPRPAAARADAPGLHALLLEVVADKTGYPADMLRPEMQLEADLGIDSIKRVEILAALQERAPHIPEVQPADVAELRSLGQIVAFLDREAPAPAVPAVDFAPPASAAAEPTGLGRWLVAETPADGVGEPRSRLPFDEPVTVVDDGTGVADALTALLRDQGVLARTAAEPAAGARHVVFLGGLAPVATPEIAMAVNRDAFLAAQAVASSGAPGTLVTVQDTGGDFGASGGAGVRAWLGGLSALVRTAAHEWPHASLLAIDLERGDRGPAALAAALARELLGGGPELEVGLHADGRRTTLSDVPTAVRGGELALAEGAVVVVSGGARGVTAACVLELARARRLRFVLLGRTPLEDEPVELRDCASPAALQRAIIAAEHDAGREPRPAPVRARVTRLLANREIRATLAATAATGSEALYFATDVTDASALAEVLRDARARLGPVRGLIHGAGVLADRRIADKAVADFDRVFATKVAGLHALLAATADDPLELIACFSSVAARAGNAGQSDYAMANEVLNLVAATERVRRGNRTLVRAIEWGPWEGGMVGPELAERFRQRGVPLIPLDVGPGLLRRELCDHGDAVRVVLGGAPALPSRLVRAATGRTARREIEVSDATHPFLEGHRIDGVPVLPAALVLEWFADVARRCRPDLVLAECRDVRVHAGVRLGGFATRPERLVVSAREIANGASARLSLELRGASGQLHYRAMAEMTAQEGRQPPRAPAGAGTGGSGPWTLDEIYDGDRLFHGAAFRAIRSLDALGDEAGAATLAGAAALGWPERSWCTDPAMLDGGIQLALLHTIHLLGSPSLPTRIGSFALHRAGLADGPVTCTLRRRSHGPYRTVTDLVFASADGTLIAELRELEMHVRPVATGERAAERVEEDSVSR